MSKGASALSIIRPTNESPLSLSLSLLIVSVEVVVLLALYMGLLEKRAVSHER